MNDVVLHCGDAMEWLPTLEAHSIDAIITDLPYGTTACAWDTVIPFAPMWEQVRRVLKPRGVFVTTASQPFTSALVMSNAEWFRYAWVWDKQVPGAVYCANLRPLKYHEDVCVFYESQPTYNPQMWSGQKNHSHKTGTALGNSIYGNPPKMLVDLSGWKYPRSILEFQKHSASEDLHPTQKPVALYEYLIRTYTNPGDTVLDFVMGSGTTGVAAIETGRRFVGCELDEQYFKVAQRRIADAQARPPLIPHADLTPPSQAEMFTP